MDDIITVLFFVIFIFANIAGERIGKKNRPPQTQPPRDENGNVIFDIPTLANDPNFPAEEPQLAFKETVQTEEVREFNIETYRQRKVAAQSAVKASTESKNFAIDLTPASAMNAIVLGEILGKPKSMRRR